MTLFMDFALSINYELHARALDVYIQVCVKIEFKRRTNIILCQRGVVGF